MTYSKKLFGYQKVWTKVNNFFCGARTLVNDTIYLKYLTPYLNH